MTWEPPPPDFESSPVPGPGYETAIEPSRVLILTTDQQRMLVGALEIVAGDRASLGKLTAGLLAHIERGDEYDNEVDELAKVTARKRRLEEEVNRCKARITALEPTVIEQWVATGATGMTHANTGAKMKLTGILRASVNVDTAGLGKEEAAAVRAAGKQRAGAALARHPEYAGLVGMDFNLNSLSARFREAKRAYDEAQRALPEHERAPLDPQSLLPEDVREFLRLDASPRIEIRF